MVKVMIFIDFQNFQIELNKLYDNKSPNLDYIEFPKKLINYIDNSILIKTYLFHPKPDEFLMRDNSLRATYNWVNGVLNKFDFFEVVEGEYIARPTDKSIDMDIEKPNTYYKVEKGTDINIATQMLTKAFNNSFDCAILLSGDSDYIPVLDQLKSMGKVVIVAGIQGQNVTKLKNHADKTVSLNKDFFSNCTRK